MRTKKNNTNIQQQQPRRKEKRKYANEINESSRCVRVCLCCVCIHCIMIWFFLYLSLRAPIEWIGRWISNMQHETRASMLMEIAHMHTLILIIIAHTQQFWLDFFSCKWIFAFFSRWHGCIMSVYCTLQQYVKANDSSQVTSPFLFLCFSLRFFSISLQLRHRQFFVVCCRQPKSNFNA